MPVFYKKAYSRSKSVYYPRVVVKGKPATIDDIAKVLAEKSCVTPNDVVAVLKGLDSVIGKFLSEGRSVKIDSLGSFRYGITSRGVANEANFDFQTQLRAVRVVFTPERKKSTSGAITRASVDDNALEWMEWGGVSTNQASSGGSSTDETFDPLGS